MRLWAARALTIVLLVASAFPPPRVANFLIANVLRQDAAEAKKPTQARGRNRIGSPARLDCHRALACLSGADWKPPRPPRAFSRLEDAPDTIHRPTPPALSLRPALRLRC